jgi:hypothetical protein
MRSKSSTYPSVARLGSVLAVYVAGFGCAAATETATVPAAPIVSRWPDPAFLPERQCRGTYSVAELEQYLPRAQVALQLPSTQAVAVDAERHCLVVTVEDVGTGRLTELVLRGVAVPRAAVLLQLAEPELAEPELEG